MDDGLTSHDILAPDGRIAARLARYEHRPQQLEMAEAVTAALQQGHHLIVEAGTGVGKSFGYLVPAILATLSEVEESEDSQRQNKKKRRKRLMHSPIPKSILR